MKRFYDDQETIARWRYAFGFISVCVLWAVVFVLASGIL